MSNIRLRGIKKKSNYLTIDNILNNEDNINDLLTNTNSKFKYYLTLDNIKQLIKYCFKYNEKPNEQQLRYAYYSCQILCSKNVLFFYKSIKNIKEINHENNNILLSEQVKEKVFKKMVNSNCIIQLNDNNKNELEEKLKDNFTFCMQMFEEYKGKSQIINNTNIEYNNEVTYIINEILKEIFDIINNDKFNKFTYFT